MPLSRVITSEDSEEKIGRNGAVNPLQDNDVQTPPKCWISGLSLDIGSHSLLLRWWNQVIVKIMNPSKIGKQSIPRTIHGLLIV